MPGRHVLRNHRSSSANCCVRLAKSTREAKHSRSMIFLDASAPRSYQLFKRDPSHPSLHFKKVNAEENLYSVPSSESYRAWSSR